MDSLHKSDRLTLKIERIAHGGEGIALHQGKVVFVKGAFPGDEVQVDILESKKSFARAVVHEVVHASPMRVAQRCPAAAAGAGCCDFGELDPAAEISLKKDILIDQLRRLGKVENTPPIQVVDLQPNARWRTRVRLGVDSTGRAGFRRAQSNEVISGEVCVQAVEGLLDGVVGPQAPAFTPGAEVVAVRDDEGNRHVVEVRRAPRGRRNEKVTNVIEGSGLATQEVGGVKFQLPAVAFWQAHLAAPEAYSEVIRRWLSLAPITPRSGVKVIGWDLYGGVGAFVPAIMEGIGVPAVVHSVEASHQAANAGRAAFKEVLSDDDAHAVVFHPTSVERALDQLPEPDVVVLDPPRIGAGATVVEAVAAAAPAKVIHIGCDPATFARDTATWTRSGYRLVEVVLFNAFPGTHHMEAVGLFEPA